MAFLINGGGKLLLVGTVDADTLDATAGTDSTLIGLAGNDIYIVDSVNDIVVEDPGAGVDRVQSSVSYALTPNVENLILTGSASINGTGNELSNSLTGNDGNNVLDGGLGGDTMAGGNGNDTYIVDNALDVVTEAVNAGNDTILASVTYVLSANVEQLVLTGAGNINGTGNGLDNAITGNGGNNVLSGGPGNDVIHGGDGNDTIDGGDGNDQLFGGAGDDILTGGAGNDYLEGGAGIDTFTGGAGNDYYVVGAGDKPIVEAAGGGDDTVDSTVGWTLEPNVENLILHAGAGPINGTGNALNNHLFGNESSNTLIGLAGNDTLDGGAGADTLIGGQGNDTYVVDNSGDQVVELPGAVEGAADKVIASIGFYQLPNSVENLQLTGSNGSVGYGNDAPNVLVGNAGDNFLLGFGGNDILDGGPGGDNMQGGLGNDTYYFDNPGDFALEFGNGTPSGQEGVDTIISSVEVNLRSMFNVENVTLTGTANVGAFGNDLPNVLNGNVGNNFIDGGGGGDTMAGGLGDDTYIVDRVVPGFPALSDAVVEGLNGGNDSVITYTSYVLPANVEKLVLGNTAGNITGTGNALDNVIQGNPGNNTIDGGAGNDSLTAFGGDDLLIGGAGNDILDGGTGQDVMQGGVGDDSYFVDTLNDVITELPGAGTDTVRSTIAFDLSISGANVENLTLLGSGDLNGTGNALNNVITGNDGTNSLSGGLGNDTLFGGAGNDTLDGGAGDDILNGGTGTDGMTGGIGNDIYVVDNPGDNVVEGAAGGIDTVQSSISFDLNAKGANVENLSLTGVGDIDGTGNTLNNVITGNDGANTLDGHEGNNTLRGGKGDDTYMLHSAGDTVTENVGEGLDAVDVLYAPAGLAYTLGANLEVLLLDGANPADNLKGTGNALDNLIGGNDGNNTLDGGAGNDLLDGGAGNDTLIGGLGNDLLDAGSSGTDVMTGGLGDDLYVISSATQTIVELAGQGTDSIHADVNYDMSGLAAPNVEDLWLDDEFDDNNVFVGVNNLNGTGNALNNKIFASGGDDIVQGGGGNDTFYFMPHDLDVTQWATFLGTGPNMHFPGIKMDSGDTVWGATTGVNSGDPGTDTLFADVVNLNGQLHVHGVENITLFSGSTGATNIVNASDITGASNIIVSDISSADAADFPGSAAANLALTNLAAGTTIIGDHFHKALGIALATNTGADTQNVTLKDFSGALTTSNIETVNLNIQQPADGSSESADMSASTGLQHVGLSGPSGVLSLKLPTGTDLNLHDANLDVHVTNTTLSSLNVNLDNSGMTLRTDSALSSVNLDTTGTGGPSFVDITPSGAPNINVTGDQSLEMYAINQNVDAHDMTGDLFLSGGDSSSAVTLIGGAGNDKLNGGAGNDRIDGGSDGVDLLFGAGGADTFVFDHAPTANAKYLTDFTSGTDQIELNHNNFAGLTLGTLQANQFFKGDPADPVAMAGASGPHVVFEQNSGNLYYDPTSTTAGDEQLIANVWYNNNVEHTDIHVV